MSFNIDTQLTKEKMTDLVNKEKHLMLINTHRAQLAIYTDDARNKNGLVAFAFRIHAKGCNRI